jgi:hypothetical protein
LYGHVVHEVNFGEGQLGYGIQLVRPLLADHCALPFTSGYAAVGRPEILAPPLKLHRPTSQLETAVHHAPIPVPLPLR